MISARDILVARERLAEHKALAYSGEDDTNETNVSFTRYWSDIPESEIDLCLEFLRRWVSVLNQDSFTITVAVVGGIPDVSGTYIDSGGVEHGCPVFVRSDGVYELRLAALPNGRGFFWMLRKVSDEVVIWVSSAGPVRFVGSAHAVDPKDYWSVVDGGYLVPLPLDGSVPGIANVAWAHYGIDHDTADSLFVSDNWLAVGDGIVEPGSGTLTVGVDLPASGMVYRSVEDPLVNNGKTRTGTWRAGKLRHEQENGSWKIFQTLHLELNTSASIASGSSRWRFRNGSEFQSGSGLAVLELPFCDPSVVDALAKVNSARSYTDAIYTVNGGLLGGKWYSIRQEPAIDPATGFGVVTWYLSRYYNLDLIFSHRASRNVFVVDFFKLHVPPDTVFSFLQTYYFDADGNFYVSADGDAYTNKNGVAVTPEGSFSGEGIEAHTVVESVAGRRVSFEPVPDTQTGETNIHVRFEFTVEQSHEGAGGLPIIVFGEAIEKIKFMGEYSGIELPSNEQLLGVVAAGGRSKTVTRIANPRIEDGLFYYLLYEYEYTAPMNDGDAWFVVGSASTMERERRSLFNMITDQAGYSGWEPIDMGWGAFPRANVIEVALMTPRNILRERKYFVRQPTDADIVAAGIVSSMNDFDNYAPDARTTVVHDIGGGGNLFWVERVTTTIDYDATMVDQDGFSKVEQARLRTCELITGNFTGTPTGVAAVASGSDSITVSWNAVSGAEAYQVRRGETTGGPYQAFYYGPGIALEIEDMGLDPETTYYYVVVAVSNGVAGAASAEASATTEAEA